MKQSILLLSTIFLGLSITLQSEKAFQEDNNIIEYETINLKNISSSKNIIRNEENTIELDNLLTSIWSLSMLSTEESKEEQTELNGLNGNLIHVDTIPLLNYILQLLKNI